MTNHITPQIESIALLIFFGLWFLYVIYRLYNRVKSRSLLSRNRTLKKLKKLSWDEFEFLCMELLSKMGWIVHGNEKKGADGGVDIWMQRKTWSRKRVSAIVQCKRYDDALVTIRVIREMYGLMHEHGVEKVYVITSSRFTKECYQFTKDKPIVLIDGKELIDLISIYS